MTEEIGARHPNPRVAELLALQDSGVQLPLPATWIATLEEKGITVDLVTGQWLPTVEILDTRMQPTAPRLPP